jgi:HAD superfamily hydrolase (TIGR01490 family)
LPVPAAAFFDVDGTLTRTTILHPLLWFQRAHLGKLRFLLWAARALLDIPRYLWIDRTSRGQLNIVFYRRYAGLNAEELNRWHEQAFAQTLKPRLFPAARDCLREHRLQGRRIVLVTGGLDFIMHPLAHHIGAADVIANRLVEQNGTLTGELDGAPVADENKGEVIQDYARKHDIDLKQSFAYSDSIRDLSMLQIVGHPVAVNPDRRLRELAQECCWPVVAWH